MTISHPCFAVFTLALCLLATTACREDRAATAAREKILLIGNGAEPRALDPHMVQAVGDSNILRSMFEGLVTYHPVDDSAHNPGVAESWTPNDDFTVWTFRLRKDAKWSNGATVTADDFIYSFNRILHPEMGAIYASMLYFLKNGEIINNAWRTRALFENTPDSPAPWETLSKLDIAENPNAEKAFNQKGLDGLDLTELEALSEDLTKFSWKSLEKITEENQTKYVRQGPDLIDDKTKSIVIAKLIDFLKSKRSISDLKPLGVTAPDPFTLICELEDPSPFFPDVVKHTAWLPVHKPTIEKHGTMTAQYSVWQKPGNSVSNGAFKLESWRINSHVKVVRNPHYWDAQNVKPNGVVFYPYDNTYTEERAFRDGMLHVTYVLPPNLIDWYREKRPDALRVETYAGSYFYRCNVNRTPTNNKFFRKALAYAIDQESIVKYVTMGGQQPAFGFTPPSEGGYQPPDIIHFDPEKARDYLRQAGYKSGADVPPFTIILNTNESHKSIAVTIQDMWKKHLGLSDKSISITNQEWKVFQQTVKDIDYDVARAGWIGDYVDPTTFLGMWRTGDSNNTTGWSNPAYDRLLKEASRLSSNEDRYAKLNEAESILLDELPVLPIYWYTRVYGIRPEVRNWNPLLLDNHPYKHIDLQPTSK